MKRLVTDSYETWRELQAALAKAGIELRDYRELTNRERSLMETYFRQVVYPVLTPLAFDPGRPFPHISNLSLNLAVAVRDQKGVERFARVKIPDTLPQLVPVSMPDQPAGSRPGLIWLEQLIIENLHALFPGLEIIEAYPFRVTRDAEVEIQELESDDLLETIEEAVWQRRFRAVVRLQVSREIPEHLLETLIANLELDPRDVYRVDGPLDLSRLRQLLAVDRPDLKDAPFLPYTPPQLNPKSEDDIFTVLRRDDVLLHHPFDSFQPVVEFLRRAAVDPDVLAIKITLYRVGRNSPIVESLLSAIENGKQVAVLVELKARFDEESNIEWARALEAAGVHVVYGLRRLEGPFEGRPCCPPRRRYHAPLRASGHWELQPDHRPPLYRPELFHLRRPDRRRRHGPVQLRDRLFREKRISQASRRAHQHAREAGGTDPA